VDLEAMQMSILVAYASKHGATRELAERISQNLRSAGLQADVRAAGDVGDLAAYEGFVVGSAAYMGHWLKEAVEFVRGHQHLLAQRPVWLFSSGPLGTEATNAKGEDMRVAAEPRELPEFRESIHPREHHVFFGALDPAGLSFTERSLRKLPAARAVLPEGDFRDWDEVEEWTQGIAREMAKLDTARDS
jgi:menaquinone-dependent protoporphyrinogen oxidase